MIFSFVATAFKFDNRVYLACLSSGIRSRRVAGEFLDMLVARVEEFMPLQITGDAGEFFILGAEICQSCHARGNIPLA